MSDFRLDRGAAHLAIGVLATVMSAIDLGFRVVLVSATTR
jgi:hypothetical protein